MRISDWSSDVCSSDLRDGRGPHVEGGPGPLRVHRMREMSERVSGLEHRQAALAEALDHEPAGPPVRGRTEDPRGRKDVRRYPEDPARPGDRGRGSRVGLQDVRSLYAGEIGRAHV